LEGIAGADVSQEAEKQAVQVLVEYRLEAEDYLGRQIPSRSAV
jgi:hypothetical protein